MQPSGLLRNMRNVVHNYTEVEIKVREATSNDPWGPSSSIMAEISDLTYQVQPFPEIMAMLWKRLSDHGKNWRHVYKSLMLLDYLVKTGSERVAAQCKENIYCITTLKDFQFVDRDGKDQGANVRERAKQLVSLLQDEDRLRSEREKSLKNKERFSKATTGIGSHSSQQIGYSSTATPGFGMTSSSTSAIRSSGEEELQLQLALAMSKEEADEAEKARREDQVRVELAIKESLKDATNQQSAIMADARAQATQPAPPPAPTSNVDDLLSLDLGPSQPQPQHQNPPPDFNPWGGGGAAPAPAAPTQADPFGADPWGAPAAAAAPAPAVQASNPWGGPAATQAPMATPSADPWGAPSASDPFAAPAQQAAPPQPASNDPFGDPFGAQPPAPAQPAQPEPVQNDMFSLPPNPDPVQPNPAAAASPFDLGGLGSSLPPQPPAEPEKKTAQSFLGSAAGLVNLDNLVQKPKQPAATNPFGMSTSMAPQVKSNPFHNASPGPSMAEMARSSQSQQMGLQQPMAPSPVNTAQSPFGAPMMSQPFGMDAGQNQKSNNPFL